MITAMFRRNPFATTSCLWALVLMQLIAAPARADWVSAGLQGNSVRAIVQNTSGVRFAAAGEGLRRSFDQGASWSPIGGELFSDAFAAVAYRDSNLVFVSVETGTYRTIDDGASWQFLGDDIAGTYSMAIAPNLDLYASGAIGTLRSTDRGFSWSLLETTPGSFVDGVVIDKDGRVFVKTIVDNLFRSTDHGASWDTLDPGPDYKSALAVSPLTGTLLVGTQTFEATAMLSVYRSTDHGDSWQTVVHRPGGADALGFLSNGGALLAGDIVLFSPDDGITWVPRNAGMPPDEQVRSFCEIDGMVYAGMRRDGIYRQDGLLLPVADPPAQSGRHLQLTAAPSRFAARTTLRFALPRPGRVRLDVFDLYGRRQSHVTDAEFSAGIHAVPLEAGSFPPGLYFARLSTSAGSATARLVVLR